MDWFELFNGTCPKDLPLDESPVDTGRVLARVRRGVDRKKKPRKLGRMVRTGLIAAALIAALGVTAYAVYEMFIDKYVIEQPGEFETEEEATERSRTRISMTGYQGTPEYQAYTEWEAWLRDWKIKAEENDPWEARGVDDSWHETPDNYAVIYEAYFQDQADALDAIVEKYGLTLHQDREIYYRSTDLYEALGTEPFFGSPVASIGEDYDVTGYIYDDGSFAADFEETLSGERTVSMRLFVNAKGSFAMISDALEMSEDNEAWQYETAGGETVDMYLTPNDARIMMESAGAYLEVAVDAGGAPSYDPSTDPRLSEEEKQGWLETERQMSPDRTEAEYETAWQKFYDDEVARKQSMLPPAITEEDLETIADSIDFAVLAARFDGAARPETADVLPVLKEREEERYAYDEDTALIDALSADTIAKLGRYAPSVFPESFTLLAQEGPLDQDMLGLEGTGQFADGTYIPSAAELDSFAYYRITDSPTEPAAYLPTIRQRLTERFTDGEITDETVQGHPAILMAAGDYYGAVYWYDEDADLLFNVGIEAHGNNTVERDAVLALAESVEKIG